MLSNVLLDGFPNDYKGFKINTDYRVGILISLLFDDDEIEDDLKIMQAIELLYIDKPADFETAQNGVLWFISCGKSELCYADGYVDERPTEKCLDFTQDALDIWGAFWSKGIDLNEVNMHWFKFMSAIGNLGDCALTQKMGYRATDLTKMQGETKKHYSELKDKYRVRRIVTKDEMDEIIEKAEQKHGSYYAKLLAAQRR